MLRFVVRLAGFVGFIVGSATVLLAVPPGEMAALRANAGWEEMGAGSASGRGISNNDGFSTNPTMAVGLDRQPIVAWADTSSGSEIYVRRWSGTAWVEIGVGSDSGGGISNNTGGSIDPVAAVARDGSIIVAWSDGTMGNYEIYVKRWNGSSWVEIGNASASGGGISNNTSFSRDPSLVIDANGAPIVAWNDATSSFNGEIFVRRWNGAIWEELGRNSASAGGISNDSGISYLPTLAIAPNGMPMVAWTDASGASYEIFIRRWNGSSWVEVGSNSAVGGGISNSGPLSYSPSLVFTTDGLPTITWVEDFGGNSEIFVRRWNGSTWVEMGNGSASGGGISNTAGASHGPSMTLGSDGRPVIMWVDNTSGNNEIYLRRWNGAAWVEMGSGSASGGGISMNAGSSWNASLAVVPGGKSIAAWRDNSSGNDEIYVRQHPTLLTQRIYAPMTTLARCMVNTGEIEPNNNPAQATGPLCPALPYSGLPNDHFDIFYLDAQAGRITIELTNHAGGSDVQLQLHHQQLSTSPIGKDIDGSNGYRIDLPNAPAGRYYILISNPDDSGGPTPYTLTATFNMSP